MLIGDPSRDSIDLRIDGYQYPSEIEEYFDANWLMISVKASMSGRGWESLEPVLTTFEVLQFCNWLEKLANGEAVERELEFVEPCYTFIACPGETAVNIRVRLELEVRPPWLAQKTAGHNDCFLELKSSKETLIAVTGDLRAQLQQYPIRGEALPFDVGRPQTISQPIEVKADDHFGARVAQRLKGLFR